MNRFLLRAVVTLVLAVAVLGGGGCRKKSRAEVFASQRTVALTAREVAATARTQKRPKVAVKAARRAEGARDQLKALLKDVQEPPAAELQIQTEVAAAARAARRFAGLAEEDQRLEKLRSSLKTRAYLKARSLAFSALCNSCALATEQAAKQDPAAWPVSARDTARFLLELLPAEAQPGAAAGPVAPAPPAAAANSPPAAVLPEAVDAEVEVPPAPVPVSAAELQRIAARLRTAAVTPPPEVGVVLGVALYFSGQPGLALAEFAQADLSQLRAGGDARQLATIARAIALSTNGMPLLAQETLEPLAAAAAPGEPEAAPRLLATAHGVLAYLAHDDGDYARADAELLAAMKAWPENPFTVMLTGERLADNGEHVKAAEALDVAAADAKFAWVAPVLAERARDIRDHPEKVQSLVRDPVFIGKVAWAYAGHWAGESGSARRLQRWLGLAKDVDQQLPLPGAVPGPAPAPIAAESAASETPVAK